MLQRFTRAYIRSLNDPSTFIFFIYLLYYYCRHAVTVSKLQSSAPYGPPHMQPDTGSAHTRDFLCIYEYYVLIYLWVLFARINIRLLRWRQRTVMKMFSTLHMNIVRVIQGWILITARYWAFEADSNYKKYEFLSAIVWFEVQLENGSSR